MRELIFIIVVLFITTFHIVAQETDSISENYSELLGSPLPAINMTSLTNKNWTSELLEDKVVLVTFLSMECGVSMKLIPYLNDLQEKYKNEDFIILAFAPQTEKDLRKFNSRLISKYSLIRKLLVKERVDFELIPLNIKYFQGKGIDNLVSSNFLEQIKFDYTYPVTLIIDKKGIIRYCFKGLQVDNEMNFIDNYEDEIEKLVNNNSY